MDSNIDVSKKAKEVTTWYNIGSDDAIISLFMVKLLLLEAQQVLGQQQINKTVN